VKGLARVEGVVAERVAAEAASEKAEAEVEWADPAEAAPGVALAGAREVGSAPVTEWDKEQASAQERTLGRVQVAEWVRALE